MLPNPGQIMNHQGQGQSQMSGMGGVQDPGIDSPYPMQGMPQRPTMPMAQGAMNPQNQGLLQAIRQHLTGLVAPNQGNQDYDYYG